MHATHCHYSQAAAGGSGTRRARSPAAGSGSNQRARLRLNVTSAGPRVADIAETEIVPLVKEADPEFERLLAEEEDIQRRIVDTHEAPKFGRE